MANNSDLLRNQATRWSDEHLTLLHLAGGSEQQEALEVIRGLSQTPKTLSAKYFYDERGSQLFEQICELPEYYPTRTEAWILRQYAPEIARVTGGCELVELGSGSSSKTRFLLNAYQSLLGYPCKYIPIDVSKSALAASVVQLRQEYPGLVIQGLVGSYEQALACLKPSAYPRRMIFFLGSSLGNFAPAECDRFFAEITSVLKAGDYFLLGIDLQKSPEILELAYNDSQGITAEFNLNMLYHLNWRFQGNFVPDLFTHRAIYNLEKSQIEMYLVSQKAQEVRLETLDLNIFINNQESILTEISRKFNLQEMQQQLAAKGLTTIKTYTDLNHWFGLILCQKDD